MGRLCGRTGKASALAIQSVAQKGISLLSYGFIGFGSSMDFAQRTGVSSKWDCHATRNRKI
jgi:hypothetical protein